MAETARLLAVAEHAQRLARLGRLDETGQNHTVPPGLPRADGVENSRHDDRQLALGVEGEREKFVHQL